MSTNAEILNFLLVTFSVEIRQLDNHENQTELWSFGLEESYKLANKA